MPVSIEDIVAIPLQKDEILSAIAKAKKEFFIDNLRHRHSNVSFDSKLRGYIGEMALKRWLEEKNIHFSTSNYIEEEGNMDIDFLYQKGSHTIEVELKTSLIPDGDGNFEKVLWNRDIKLIRRNNEPIEQLKSDIHIQVYFKQLRKKKDKWLQEQAINLDTNDLDYLYNCFAGYRYLNDTYLFAWIDKPSLIKMVNAKPVDRRTWHYGLREFWRCNLKTEAKKPLELVDYLNNF